MLYCRGGIKWGLLFVMFIALGLQSCSSSRKITNTVYPKDKIPSVADEVSDIGLVSEEVSSTAAGIDGSASSIEKEIPEDIKPRTSSFFSIINDGTNKLRSLAETLREIQSRLENEQDKADDLAKHIQTLETDKTKLADEIKELKDENGRLLKKMLAWLAAASVAGIGICVFMIFLTQNKFAMFAAVGCAATMVLAVAVSAYMAWIAFITAIVFAVVSIIAGFYVWKKIINNKQEMKEQKSENKNLNTSFKEVVDTSELAKKYMSDDAKTEVFGSDKTEGKIDQLRIQSDYTKSLVRQIRHPKDDKKDDTKSDPLFRKIE